MQSIVFWYFIGINILVFLLWGFDKYIAIRNGNTKRKKQRRIPEKTLLYGIVLGGSIGGLMGMELFKHKRRKGSFLWKFIGVVLFQCAIFLVIIYTSNG